MSHIRSDYKNQYRHYQSVEAKYKEAINAPRNYLELYLAINNPNSEISKEFTTLLLTREANREAFIKFQYDLVMAQLNDEAQRKAELLEELEYDDLAEKTRLLNESIASQSQTMTVKQPDLTSPISKLLENIKKLQNKMTHLATQYFQITQQQVKLHQQWNATHHASATQFVSAFADYLNKNSIQLFDPDGNVIKWTPEKQKQLVNAVTPISPIIITEAIADRFDPDHPKHNEQLGASIANFNKLVGVINFAKCMNGDEKQPLLEGKDAIKALKTIDSHYDKMGKMEIKDHIANKIAKDFGLDEETANKIANKLIEYVQDKIATRKVKLEFIKGGRYGEAVAKDIAKDYLQEDLKEELKGDQSGLTHNYLADMVMKIATPKPASLQIDQDQVATMLLQAFKHREKKNQVQNEFKKAENDMKSYNVELDHHLQQTPKKEVHRPKPPGYSTKI
jgi:hypothetical protein